MHNFKPNILTCPNYLIILSVENQRQTQLLADIKRLAESLGPLPEPVAQPVFIAVSGLPGTGKSYLSLRLAERLPLVILESDALRKVLFHQPSYSWRESARLFRACYRFIEILLSKGISVILDATNLEERYREELYHIAEKVGVKLIMVRVTAPPALVRERLEARLKSPSTSEAGWEIYQAMKATAERIRRQHYVVDTSRDITPVVNKIVREARKGA